MSTVTGSKQYKSIVVQDRPEQRWLLIIAVGIFVIGVGVTSFWFGGQDIREDHDELQQAYQQTVEKLQQVETEYQDVSQQLTNVNVGAEVDRQAVEEVRAVVREHKQTITELNEEIAFYKGLMAPTERERGLSIRSWEIYPLLGERRYQYKLVMQQLAVKHLLLKGSVSIELVGRQGLDVRRVSLNEISEQMKQKNVLLRFKYFQYIEGELQLPDGFIPERIDVVAKANKPKVVQVEKQYGWLVQGADELESQQVQQVVKTDPQPALPATTSQQMVKTESAAGGELNGVQ